MNSNQLTCSETYHMGCVLHGPGKIKNRNKEPILELIILSG